MGPFEFMILLFSFIYTIGFTHLLFAMTRMIRHRRELIFSWPHFLWMLVAFINQSANWIALYDFHRFERLTLPTIATGLLLTVIGYLECALVSPDFEGGESYDLRAFHDQESVTYIGIVLILVIGSLVANYLAGAGLSVQNWGAQNALVLAMLPLPILALIIRKPWVQVAVPLLLLVLVSAFVVLYYPVLDKAVGG